MKILIVDDEQTICMGISKMLDLFCENTDIVGTCGSVSSAIDMINEKKPDLVLLDIKIEGGTGFDVIKALKSDMPKVIFITAYENYAVKAFKYNAIDYIMKPIDPDELETAVRKLSRGANTMYRQEIIDLLKETMKNKDLPEKIVLKTQESIHVVKIKDIIYCASDGPYTTFYTEKEKVMVSKSIKSYTELLNEHNFVRIHQSFLINMNKVVKYDKECYVILEHNIKLPLAGRRKDLFLKSLSDIFV